MDQQPSLFSPMPILPPICSPELLQLEGRVFRAYWDLLRSDLPAEWTVDERRALVAQIEQLRDAEGRAMVAAEFAGEVAEFELRRGHYEALATTMPEAEARP